MIPTAGLYGHIRSNNLKSVGLFLSFALTLSLLWAIIFQIFTFGFNLIGWLPSPLQYEIAQNGTFLAIVKRLHYPFLAALLWTLAGFYFHAHIIRFATGATIVRRRDEPKLYSLVENLSIVAGIPMPRVEIMESTALNAYASGLSPGDANIAVTRGLLDALDERELEAVLAHEITHIRNYDTRMMVIAAVLSGGMCMLAELIWRHVCRQKVPLACVFEDAEARINLNSPMGSIRSADGAFARLSPGRIALLLVACFAMPFLIMPAVLAHFAWRALQRRDAARSGTFTILPPMKLFVFPPLWPVLFLLLVVNLFLVVVYVLSVVARSAISRSREFMADAGAIELTKDPHALVSALAKVANHDAIEDLEPSVAALMISAPSSGWLATHPAIEERIAALQQFAGAPRTSSFQRRNGVRVLTVDRTEFGKPADITTSGNFGRRRTRPAGGTHGTR